MKVILIRHGKAEDAAAHGGDAERALTREGREEMRKAAQGLAELVERADVLASSPLVRARQTAEIVGEALGAAVEECRELEPGRKPERLMKWLRERGKEAEVVLLVGHEPGLSRCAGFMLSGEAKSVVEMKKGAACAIEFEGEIGAGRGVLKWLMDAKQLKRMRKGRD